MLQKVLIGVGGTVLFSLLNIISNAFLARIVGPVIIGQYQLILSAGMIIVTLAAVGIGDAIIFSLNNLKLDRFSVANSVLSLACLMGGATFVIASLVYRKALDYFGHLSWQEAILAAGGLVLLLLAAYLRPLVMAELKIGLSTFASNVGQSAFLLLLGVLYLFSIQSLLGALSAYFFTNSAIVLILLIGAHLKARPKWQSATVKILVLQGLRFATVNILVVVYTNATILMLNAVHTESIGDIGIYSRAVTISNLLTFVPTALGGLIFARWSSSDLNRILEQVTLTIRISFAVSLAGILVVYFLGKEIVLLLYGAEYAKAVNYLTMLTITALISNVALIQRSFIVGRGDPRGWSYALIISLSVLAFGIWCLYPTQGLMAGPISLSISNTVLILLGFYHLRRYGIQVKDCLWITPKDITLLYQRTIALYPALVRNSKEAPF